MQKVGLIGGTGLEGRGIALRLGRAGLDVLLGSRSAERASKIAAELNAQLQDPRVSGADNRDVIGASELLFLTVPFHHATAVLKEHRQQLVPHHVLVDVTVPLVFEKGPQILDLKEGSGSEHLRQNLPPHVPLAATFKTVPAHLLCELSSPLDCDEFICSDCRRPVNASWRS